MVSCPALSIWCSPDPLGLNGKCQTSKLVGWLFLEERAPKKGRNDLERQEFLVDEMGSKGTKSLDFLGEASGAET